MATGWPGLDRVPSQQTKTNPITRLPGFGASKKRSRGEPRTDILSSAIVVPAKLRQDFSVLRLKPVRLLASSDRHIAIVVIIATCRVKWR